MGENGSSRRSSKIPLKGMLDAELTEHLGYEKYSPAGKNTGNSRNGKTHKTPKKYNGEIELTVPRDRNGSFDPVIVKKYERTLVPIEDKIISMYAKGMTTRDIQLHVQEFYVLDISASLVSQITGKIIYLSKEWHNSPLGSVYPIVFFDAINYKVTSEGKVSNKAAYTCLALDITSRKVLFGLWVSEAEGANLCPNVMTELKNRRIQDILIAFVDGLKGFTEAINTVFPGTETQLCIIHLIRNTLRYIARKDQKFFMKELRLVYSAPTEEATLIAFDRIEENWGKKYSLSIRTWRENWA